MSPVALVTGGAVRVGGALSVGLAEAGYDLVVHYHTSGAAARETVRRVEALGRRAIAVQADLCAGAGTNEVMAATREAYGRLDLLVNSAASFESARLLEIDERAWDRVMAVNLKAPFLMARAAADLLRATRGSVVNLVDLSALEPWIERPHHAVSKAGLLHLTRIMARSLAPEVRVNAVAPGTVLPPDDFDEAQRERERARTLVGHLGSPQDVLRTVLFLADSPFVTGELIVVDGGRRLSR